MTSDLCLTFLTTWLVAVSAAPGPSNLQKRSTNGECSVNGAVYQDGQRFKLSQQSCITYLCKAGGYSIVEQGCLSGGACHDVGTNFTEDCHLYTCESINSGNYVTLHKSLVRARCKDANNVCHDPGDLFPFDYNGQIHQGCTCTATGNQVAYSCSGSSSNSSNNNNNNSPRDCVLDGFTFSDGQRVSIPGKSKCVKYLCTDGHASIVQKGCDVHGFCYSVGSPIQTSCDVYKCVEEKVGNAISLHTTLIFRGCIDANSRCRAPGDKFPYVINGVVEPDCTCSDVGGMISYSCTSVLVNNNCTVNGQEFADGQEFVYPGQSKCVRYKCDKGSYKPIQEGCEVDGACHAIGSVFETNCVLKACKKTTYPDRSVLSAEFLMRRCKDSNGQCHDPGKTFSYKINGQVRNDCTCSVNGTKTSYRCGPGAGSGGAGSGQSGTQTTAGAGKNCSISGKIYTDGQVFTMPGMTKCIKYKCSNGGYRVIEEACEMGGVCHPVNATFAVSCHKYTCHKTVLSAGQISLGVQLSQIRCTASNGSCYDQGAIFSYEIGGQVRDDCTCQKAGDKISYRCGVSSPANPTVNPAVSHRNCTVNGLTYTHGQRFSLPGNSQCVLYQCMDGQYSVIQEGCEMNNACYDVGSTFQIGCHKYTCDKRTENGNNIYHGHVTQLRCSGANGKCYDVGETFPKSVNGQDFNNCSCSLDGGQVKYACQPNNLGSRSCMVNGKEHKNGETFTIAGQSKCFVYTCTDGGYKMTGDGCEVNGVCHDVGSIFPRGCHLYTCNKVHNGVSYTYKTVAQKLRCKDADDICQDPGSTFPLVIGGHRYERCTCNLVSGSLRYSCSG